MSEGLAWCQRCHADLPLSAFGRCGRGDYRRSCCRVCHAAQMKAWRERNPEKVKAWNDARPRKWGGKKWVRASGMTSARYHYRRTVCARRMLEFALPQAMRTHQGGFVVVAWRDGEINRAGVWKKDVPLSRGMSVIARCDLLLGRWSVREPVVRPSVVAIRADWEALFGMVSRLVARLSASALSEKVGVLERGNHGS